MRSVISFGLCLAYLISIFCIQPVTAIKPYYITVYSKPNLKGTATQLHWNSNQCTNWAPAIGIYARSVYAYDGTKCTVYAKHDDCGGEGHLFIGTVKDLQAGGWPTFWRSFKCIAWPRAAGGATHGASPEDAEATKHIADRDLSQNITSDLEELPGRNENVIELGENVDEIEGSTSEKWQGCPPSVAGVPYNHCGSGAGSRVTHTTIFELVAACGVVLMLAWLW